MTLKGCKTYYRLHNVNKQSLIEKLSIKEAVGLLKVVKQLPIHNRRELLYHIYEL